MFDLIIKAVRIGLLALLGSVIYSVFYLWLYGLFDVRIILIGVYTTTLISIIPYIFINIIHNVKNRYDGRWIIYIALSISLLFSVSVAYARLLSLGSYMQPISVPQLRYDGTLALSLALLGLASLLYLGSVAPDARRIADRFILALREGREEEYEVEVV
ncbi:MAG: hypothetical protein RXQ56_07620 [Thermoproteus sp.]|jgi:hypothetical protein|uniref:hypothetical protein n=1 Tax=Thermoproteus sp. CP80 TaxID=1650659 RepID=UPI0007465DB3|nr:hypothetical protein [Thermoproteus sp. CP80]KUO84300.1 MAG: hypothetical protein AT711_05395 [Thermoproteus sp. CIS_19]PLC66004.1 hypothetical protein B7L68_02050 [Thermoproteus sp. CP80]